MCKKRMGKFSPFFLFVSDHSPLNSCLIAFPPSIYFFSRYSLTIKSGQGCYLTTTDGKNYLDCVSGIATCALGHNNPALTKAIADQMATVHHVSNLYYIPEQAALANWLCENSGGDKAFFCNSGAESNEAAIKCARRHAYNRGIEVSSINDFFSK